jgi:hypothetical protein
LEEERRKEREGVERGEDIGRKREEKRGEGVEVSERGSGRRGGIERRRDMHFTFKCWL